ncbi:prolyl oligopeptidase family serine peptidase [Bacillus sp. Cr_A10]|uniref:alpha/beta hydrolase family protein n=1 Tax=Bacillus sp. Cr_A10 TaxID=3033993 RepID=UPI0023DA42A1|nr:prolyl oligopeptidase family serine peptidase [Bacillus sp. Cr_A10]MDF2067959.1 prolyl oligopeptidase family serine peptidase [Bacillus sp. Cr_A10]
MKENGTIERIKSYPSPNPRIKLSEITYWSCGYRVKGMLAEPIKNGSYEGILYCRGGMQSIGMVRPARIAQIASEGFVVFAPYYRGNRGGEGRDEFAGEDRWDAVYAVDVLKQFCLINRIHLFAFSRGGIMALWIAILRNDITSLVTWSGVSDIFLTYDERTDMRRMMKRVIGGTPTKNVEAYENRNALAHINEIKAASLIIHGKKDLNVSFEHAKVLEEALLGNDKVVETWYFHDFTHFFPSKVNRQVVKDACMWMKMQKGV